MSDISYRDKKLDKKVEELREIINYLLLKLSAKHDISREKLQQSLEKHAEQRMMNNDWRRNDS